MPIYTGNCHCGEPITRCICTEIFDADALAEIKRVEDEEDDRLIESLRCRECNKVEDCRCEL